MNPFKIQGRFKFEMLPEFLIQNPEGIGNWSKKEIWSPQNVCEMLNKWKIMFVNFKVGYFIAFGKSLNIQTGRRPMRTMQTAKRVSGLTPTWPKCQRMPMRATVVTAPHRQCSPCPIGSHPKPQRYSDADRCCRPRAPWPHPYPLQASTRPRYLHLPLFPISAMNFYHVCRLAADVH
jgi:hypothetical protein